ncbi:MAG: site-specific DNA-methyltransferase [Clostridia bacterium]|nr:site-specific DNA-methyltransferase [Clostridia bacterium]
MLKINEIYNMDCLKGMKLIDNKSIDMILCDLPYGTTHCSWDIIIPFDKLWKEYERIIKDNGAIVLTASQSFTTKLIMSNFKLFRYEWIWKKNTCTGFQNAKKMPLKAHENICVFYKKLPTYNPQRIVRIDKKIKPRATKGGRILLGDDYSLVQALNKEYVQEYKNYPKSILEINKEFKNIHPTQKPVELFEYLIRTYTNENDIVLDNCMGSGTTAIACINSNRKYIGFEKDDRYYKSAKERIEVHIKQKELKKDE